MPETMNEKETWNWLKQVHLKVEIEAMFCAGQEQVVQTNYVKYKIDKTAQSPLCRMYVWQESETRECTMLQE